MGATFNGKEYSDAELDAMGLEVIRIEVPVARRVLADKHLERDILRHVTSAGLDAIQARRRALTARRRRH